VLFTFQRRVNQAKDKQVGFLQLNWRLLLFVERKKIRTISFLSSTTQTKDSVFLLINLGVMNFEVY